MRFRALLTALALSTLGSVALHADTFTFSFGTSGDPILGAGILTGTLTSPGVYLITAVQGTTSYPGSANLNITGLLKDGAFQDNDNLLSRTGSGYMFDTNGLSYRLSDRTDVNLYTDSLQGDAESFQTRNNTLGSQYVTYSIAATPEPSSLVLLGTGLLGAIGVARRRLQA